MLFTGGRESDFVASSGPAEGNDMQVGRPCTQKTRVKRSTPLSEAVGGDGEGERKIFFPVT